MFLVLIVFAEIEAYVEMVPVGIVRHVRAIPVFRTAARSVSPYSHSSLLHSEQVLPFLELHIAFDIFLGLVVFIVIVQKGIPFLHRHSQSDMRHCIHIPDIGRVFIGRWSGRTPGIFRIVWGCRFIHIVRGPYNTCTGYHAKQNCQSIKFQCFSHCRKFSCKFRKGKAES